MTKASTANKRSRTAESRRLYGARYSRESTASVQEIGPPRPPEDPARRDACRLDFRRFLETYYPAVFYLPFSPDHDRLIDTCESVALDGGLFAFAMPRGGGKSTICEKFVEWVAAYGHRRFIVYIGSTDETGREAIDSIKTDLETNDLLLADHWALCAPPRALEGKAQRQGGQTVDGRRTRLKWGADTLILADIPGAPSSSVIIRAASITGRLRGMKHGRPDGSIARPDLVVLDDPQTDESAVSIEQNRKRIRIVTRTVLGMAGPGRKIAALMPCTVIAKGDMVDTVLNPQLAPEWRGMRARLMNAMPADTALWAQYAELRADSLRRHGDIRLATDFYRTHRSALDKGADPAWLERFLPDELSAVQHAMNLYYQDEPMFMAEYQNEPPEEKHAAIALDPNAVAARLNRQAHGHVPASATTLTAFIDIQEKILIYCAVAWEQNQTGHIIDYGAWPAQSVRHYTLRTVTATLGRKYRGTTLEGRIYAGLTDLVGLQLAKSWPREDGTEARIARILIDANWGLSTDTVYRWCRETPHAAIVMPAHGRYIGARHSPMAEWKRKPGERHGDAWVIPTGERRRRIRHVLFDGNHWKSAIARRLIQPVGEPGAILLYGDKPARHQMFADHMISEDFKTIEGRGRAVEEWTLKPTRPDNHLWDCLIGAAVAASIEGIGPATSAPRKQKTRRKLSEIQKDKLRAHKHERQ